MDRDEKLKNYIMAELKGHRLLRTVEINVDVEDGKVALYGMVDVLTEKWLAGEITRKIPGVVNVDNSLTVAMDREVSDSQIFSSVEDRIEKDGKVDLYLVEIGVNDGVVYLEGNVGSITEANSALEAAASVYGVKDVVNHIKVGGGEFSRDDASLTNDVELALSRSTLVNVRDIHTETSRGKVRLWGTVDTQDQIEAAERVAAQVPGVHSIRNEVTCRHGQKGNDIALTNQLRSSLGDHGLSSVKSFVLDGTAFLDGQVNQPDQRHRAEELASGIPGIDHVNNGIEIHQNL